MVETAAHATISATVQTAQPPLAHQTGPPPADRRPSATTTPAPSSEPATTPAAAPVTSVPKLAEATPRQAMAQPAAVSDPSPPATASEPPAAASAACHEQSGGVKKRKLEPGELRDSTYFKIRAVVRDLRPAFLEVLQAPDFRNCKAADDIRRQLKVLLGLSKLLSGEAVPSEKKTNLEHQPVAEDVKEAVEILVKRERPVGAAVAAAAAAAAAVPKQAGNAPAAAEKVMLEAKKLEQQIHQGHHGTYIVGGSPMGWNFLIYPGGGPVYYGVTREAARLRRSAA